MSSAQPQPEYFLDRSLGKETARRLRERGWIIHLIADHYANDAQDIEDEVWIQEGSQRGWALLTKDQKIRYRGGELAALHRGKLFCLASGNLKIDEMVDRFESSRRLIDSNASAASEGFWMVYAHGRAVRRWP